MIAVIVGTRPELIKMAPIMKALEQQELKYCFIHTKQHYDKAMDGQISHDLGLRDPDFALKTLGSTHATQTASIMSQLDLIFDEIKPKLVLVQGDTNTVLASSLTAVKKNISVGHIEAGLRSFDRKMPEEVNRLITDQLSTLLFAPTNLSANNLVSEGISPSKISVTGNTVVDTLKMISPKINESTVLHSNNLAPQKYILVTLHRQENVDDQSRLESLLACIDFAQHQLELPVVWPLHPRTKKRLTEFNIQLPRSWRILDPIGYIEMLALEANARLILTDSGGVQEEAYILHVPALTLRSTTERLETLSANFLVDTDLSKVQLGIDAFNRNAVTWGQELGDGHASTKIIKVINNYLASN